MDQISMTMDLNQLTKNKLADFPLRCIAFHYEKLRLIYDTLKKYDFSLIEIENIEENNDQSITIKIAINDKVIESQIFEELQNIKSKWFIININKTSDIFLIEIKNNGIKDEVDIYED